MDNTISVEAAQTMKKNIWRDLKEKGAFNRDSNPALSDAMWSAADGMAQLVNEVIPEMAGENARYGEIASLNKMLTRAANRIDNTNLISLHSAMQLIRGDFKGVAAATAMKTIDHPVFKLYLAQKLAKAQGRPPSNAVVNAKIAEIKNSFYDKTIGAEIPFDQSASNPVNTAITPAPDMGAANTTPRVPLGLPVGTPIVNTPRVPLNAGQPLGSYFDPAIGTMRPKANGLLQH